MKPMMHNLPQIFTVSTNIVSIDGLAKNLVKGNEALE